MHYGWTWKHRCSSQARQTSGTPQAQTPRGRLQPDQRVPQRRLGQHEKPQVSTLKPGFRTPQHPPPPKEPYGSRDAADQRPQRRPIRERGCSAMAPSGRGESPVGVVLVAISAPPWS